MITQSYICILGCSILSATFVGTVATSPSPLNVGLHVQKYRSGKITLRGGEEQRDVGLGSLSQIFKKRLCELLLKI